MASTTGTTYSSRSAPSEGTELLPPSAPGLRWSHHRRTTCVLRDRPCCPTISPSAWMSSRSASGLTWNGLADALGVDIKQLLRWRDGTEPCGGAYPRPRPPCPVGPRWPRPHRGGGFPHLFKEGVAQCLVSVQPTIERRCLRVFPDRTFPRGLSDSRDASGLTWSEIGQRLGTNALTHAAVGGVGCSPTLRYYLALVELARGAKTLTYLLPTGRNRRAS